MDFEFDPVLYEGRPSGKRGPEEEACYDLLEQLEIPFQRMDHSPAHTIEECRELTSILGVPVIKNLFLRNRQGTSWYLLMMPGDKPFHTKNLSEQLGVSRLSFGEEEAMEKYLRVKPGSVSILGLMYDRNREVRLFIDKDILDREYLRCHPCINTSTLRIRTDDVRNKLLPFIGHRPTVVWLPEDDYEHEAEYDY